VRPGSSSERTASTMRRCISARATTSSVEGTASSRATARSRRERAVVERTLCRASVRTTRASQARNPAPCPSRGGRSMAVSHASWTTSSASAGSVTILRAMARTHVRFSSSSVSPTRRVEGCMAVRGEGNRSPECDTFHYPLAVPTLVLSGAEIRRLLPMRECMKVMESALVVLGEGRALNPLRQGMLLPGGKGLLGMMPASMEEPPIFGLKVVAVFPGNHGTPYDSHQGVVVLFEPEHGSPVAILDAAEITAIRTAAVSGVATRLLAREDAGDLALLGSGVQARTHLEAMSVARPLRRVRVYSPSRENREAFAAREGAARGVAVEAAPSARAAVLGADLVCTTTSAREPILMGEWLAAGAHVNAVGSSVKATRELDTAAVARARLFVDRRESTLNEAGDFLFPKSEGAIGDDHILGEIGELLSGAVPGRTSPEDVTLFKSLGLAVEDLAAGHHVLAKARATGAGTSVEL